MFDDACGSGGGAPPPRAEEILAAVPRAPDADPAARMAEALSQLSQRGLPAAGRRLCLKAIAPDDPHWQRWVVGTFLADHACYPRPADKVQFDKLSRAMRAFPQGFRCWWLEHPSAGWLPVGYSGWHPVSPAQFETLTDPSGASTGRSVEPLALVDPTGPYVYVFNYSVIAPLRKSPVSRDLLGALAEDLERVRPRGLSAITVSADGARVAERLGMKRVRPLTAAGGADEVYCVRLKAHPR